MRGKFQNWAGTLEGFFVEVIYPERRDWKAGLTRALLHGCSKVYNVLIKIRRRLINL